MRALNCDRCRLLTEELARIESVHKKLLSEFDRISGQLTIAWAEAERLGRVSGRNLSRMVEEQYRRKQAEAALEAASSRPASVVRLAMRIEGLLSSLTQSRCPRCRTRRCASCGMHGVHRPHCRIESALTAIALLMD